MPRRCSPSCLSPPLVRLSAAVSSLTTAVPLRFTVRQPYAGRLKRSEISLSGHLPYPRGPGPRSGPRPLF